MTRREMLRATPVLALAPIAAVTPERLRWFPDSRKRYVLRPKDDHNPSCEESLNVMRGFDEWLHGQSRGCVIPSGWEVLELS